MDVVILFLALLSIFYFANKNWPHLLEGIWAQKQSHDAPSSSSPKNKQKSDQNTTQKPTEKETRSTSFRPIPDLFKDINDVQVALRREGLEGCNLIVGIDFTKSNTWTGEKTFRGNCLHTLDPNRINPYQSALTYIGQTLSAFDDDGLIPAFGFGDTVTSDKQVFPLKRDGPCFGIHEVLSKYTEAVQWVSLSGPTSFVPLIQQAISIVKEKQSYHILLIIADGQVTDIKKNRKALVEASRYPLSIIMVGVGDGPWDTIREFDDGVEERLFDNFQFVNFHEVMTKYDNSPHLFALKALLEIPQQYHYIKENLLK
eukprot:TRINITY_DN7967_c0_g1_i1.p1 TRINITY_DN7967_c0_g1~~TRINITY_DN7967_c0_g1_i1.p1  ORF type:complete len:314 (-),score=60.27 TRINITY_DN7967_c0_g1_i1:191-1132(-)